MRSSYILTVTILLLSIKSLAEESGKKQFQCAGQTQGEMNACAAEELRKENAAMTRALHAALSRLDDDEQRAKVKAAQDTWLKFRVAECAARNWPYREGSIYPMLRDLCLADMAWGRISALSELPLELR